MNYYSKGITKREVESMLPTDKEQDELRNQYRVQQVNRIISFINSYIKRSYLSLKSGSCVAQLPREEGIDTIIADIVEKSYTDFTVSIYLPHSLVLIKLSDREWEFPLSPIQKYIQELQFKNA